MRREARLTRQLRPVRPRQKNRGGTRLSPFQVAAAMTVPRIAPAALYFLLVALLSLPIYLLSYATHVELMPGIPLAGIAIVVPAAAANDRGMPVKRR